MFTKDFCDFLEYYISATLAKSKDVEARRCWCDGVLMPEDETAYSVEQVRAAGKILTEAWIDEGRVKGGTSGQFLYSASILFGQRALELFNKGEDLKGALPDQGDDSWISMDLQNKEMEIQLT